PGTFAPIASYELLKICTEEAEKMGLRYHVGNLLSSDVFYNDEEDLRPEETSLSRWGKMGVLAVEMEAAALYMTAARWGKRALAICTVSDHLITGEATTGEERQTSFTDMMKLALMSSLRF
ncbi:MAG: purine-nucleoside phosphorylase, partial [Clostridia bacterium]|nr:purine-nucleoside phosphorylase [Clostridia bacterium]